MKRPDRLVLTMLLLSVLAAAAPRVVASVISTDVVRKNHVWGRFLPGSWKRVRLVTETFDADGHLTTVSVVRTRTTLDEVSDDGVELKVEAQVDLAGKQLDSEPQIVKQGWFGESLGRDAKLADLGSDDVTVAGQKVPCQVTQSEEIGPAGRIVTKSWYSDRVSPYLLRRESTTYDAETEDVVSHTAVEVVTPSRSMRVRRRHRQVAELRVVHRHRGGTTRTRLWSSLEVPGGVVAHESEEFDTSGKLARRSKLDLIAYAGEFVSGPHP